MKRTEDFHTVPTIGGFKECFFSAKVSLNFLFRLGFNVETITPCRGISLTVWDVGGQAHLRALWNHYTDHVDGLVFVIDSTDRHRLAIARAELEGLYQYDTMKHVPLIVLANKQDSDGALSTEEIAGKLDLLRWPDGSYYIIPCCALTGEGLTDAFVTLAQMIRSQRKLRRLTKH